MRQTTFIRRVVLPLLLVIVPAVSGYAQESVTITLPSTVTFAVGTNSSVTGSPAPTTVTFSDAVITAGRALRISVMPASSSFSGPDGSSYPVSDVSWTVSNASGGVGSGGTLSSGSYTQLFQSNTLTPSGGLDITWRLTLPGGPSEAGTHTLTLRWKLESVQP